MVRLQKVSFHIDSIYDLDLDFLTSLERRIILIDLDNTLAPHNIMVPSAQTHRLIHEMQKRGLIPLIFSNNGRKRVKPYCSQLRVKYLASAHKPHAKRIRRFLLEMGLDPAESVVIGDQLLTDARLAKKLKATMILTEPITRKDQWTTRLLRIIDRPLRRHYHKTNMLGRPAPRRHMEDK